MSDPTHPVEVGFLETAGGAERVAVSGHYAYLADGVDGLRILDVSDPTHPVEVGFLETAGPAIGVTLSQGRAYVSDTLRGLRVIDVRDPTQPTEVGWYDTGGFANGVALSGTRAYVADGGGLFVLDCSNLVPVLLQVFSATARVGEVQLSWKVVEDASLSAYRLYRTRRGESPGVLRAVFPSTGRTDYVFLDRDVEAGETYRYTLSAVGMDGAETVLGKKEVVVEVPRRLGLAQNVPNPFNPRTVIEVRLPRAMEVDLGVYDLHGRRVATLVSGRETAGVKRYAWEGRDDAGRPVSSGVYVVRLQAGSRSLSRRMLLLR